MTYALTANVENLTLTGVGAINGTGNVLDNVLIGNSANNTLTGGAGNDTIDGGLGPDTMIGGLGNDTYIVDTYSFGDFFTDAVIENADEGIDTVQSSVTYTLYARITSGSREFNPTVENNSPMHLHNANHMLVESNESVTIEELMQAAVFLWLTQQHHCW